MYDKFLLVPIDDFKNSLPNILTIALKLCKINAYDENLKMKNNESIIDNITDLFNNQTSLSNEFINLLKTAEIDQNLIYNKEVKKQLEDKQSKLYTNINPIKIKQNTNNNNAIRKLANWSLLR